ncbi:MAG: hypothetical protein ACI9UN_004064 [Granulosicoccus sp.]|jgi:hypothetical protein
MKLAIFTIPLMAAVVCAPAVAGMVEIGAELKKYASLSNTYMSGGAKAIVHGSILSKTYADVGDSFSVFGDLRSGGVMTLGASGMAAGDVQSKIAATVSAGATVTGSVVAAGGVGTMSAGAGVGGNFAAGGASAFAIDAVLAGEWQVGAAELLFDQGLPEAIQLYKADPTSIYNKAAVAADENFLDDVKSGIDDNIASATTELINIKGQLNLLVPTVILDATMNTDRTFIAGVYSAPSWSTTAATTLLLDAQFMDNQVWVFNIGDIFAFGGVSTVKMINVNEGDSAQVIWNAGGYISIGDGANIVGTMMSDQHIMVGANSTVKSASDSSCAGLYSTASFISLGDSAVIGGEGCIGVPAPATYPLMLLGLGLMGFTRPRAKTRS